MNMLDLLPAIKRITNTPKIKDLRSITYLSTYPSILSIGATPKPIDLDRFHQLAMMAYGWMPRVIRIDQAHIAVALPAAVKAQSATVETISPELVKAIARCLHSVVGASKVLHFIKPTVFPIWDSNIERFRANRKPSNVHMNNTAHYLNYLQDVHAIKHDPRFPTFYKQYNAALGNRLRALGIRLYEVSEVRAIEAAAFDLALADSGA